MGDRDAGNATTRIAPREKREWLPLGAFVFVILSLVALAVTPAVLLHRMSRTTEEITGTLLPALTGLRDLAFAMEARVSTARSRFLTSDPRYDARLERARAAEEAALHSLEALAPRVDPMTPGHLALFRRYVARRDSLEQEVLEAGGGLDAYRAALPGFDALRDSMLVELDGLSRELLRVSERRAAAEARSAALQRTASILLGTVALLSAMGVGWFALQQRRLRREVQRTLEEANRLREQAEEGRAQLERATESRVRLLRGITHDVKNPLGAARGYAELLEMEAKAPVLPEQRPLLRGIVRSVDGALAIIADLLDLARTDSGGLAINREEVDLRVVAREAANGHRSVAEATGHTIEVQLPAESLRVYTDPARVGQVLGNLLSNASKYTPPPGRITVRAGRAAAGEGPDEGSWATIEVHDTGPGIPVDQREGVFDEFTRLDEGGAQEGHGLGLAIARRIARLLGGDLTVKDGADGGAAFVLWLPIRRESTAP